MKIIIKNKTVLCLIITFCIVGCFSVFYSSVSKADKTDLYDWQVTVHHENGQGAVQGASVYIKLNGTNQFGSPKTSDSQGHALFMNGGSTFPDGHYEVRIVREGFGDGVSYVDIVNGAPAYPRTDSNSGPAL